MDKKNELSLRSVYNDRFAFLSAAEQYGMFEAIGREGTPIEALLTGRADEVPFQRAVVLGLQAHGFLQQDQQGVLRINAKYQDALLGRGALKFYLGMPDWFSLIQLAPLQLQQEERPAINAQTWKQIIGISADSLAREVYPYISSAHPELGLNRLNALDLGCGKMYIFRQLAKINPNLTVTGVDFNSEALDSLSQTLKAEDLIERVNLIKDDVLNAVTHLEQDYDVILTSHLSHWLNKTQVMQLLPMIHSLLRPNGYFLNYDDYLASSGTYPKDSVRKHAILAAQGYQIFTREEMIQLLSDANFTKTRSKVVGRRRILFESFE